MAEKIDFMKVFDYIFKNKHLYRTLTDKDKIDNFYMINKKISIKFCKGSQFLNNKFIDNASAMDLWFIHFKNVNDVPSWYWTKSPFKKDKEKSNKIPKADLELFMKTENISDDDLKFLLTHYQDEVEYEIKKLKRFE